MDFLSHILWAVALGKYLNLKTKLNINLKWMGFFGAFPDLLAFMGLFTWSLFSGGFPHPADHAASQSSFLFDITSTLYSFGHSLIVIMIIIGVIWLIRSKVYYVLVGWLLHILLDIPTHTRGFYPTPFLWPLSTFVFDGISWGQQWFLIVNYSLLVIVFYYLYKKEINKLILRKHQ